MACERLTDKELSEYAEHLDTSYEYGAIERRVVEELIERRAADRERETRQQTHSAECWHWHPECAAERVGAFKERFQSVLAMDEMGGNESAFDAGMRCAMNIFNAAMAGRYGKGEKCGD